MITSNGHGSDRELVGGIPRHKPQKISPLTKGLPKFRAAAVIERVAFECGCVHDIVRMGAFSKQGWHVTICAEHTEHRDAMIEAADGVRSKYE